MGKPEDIKIKKILAYHHQSKLDSVKIDVRLVLIDQALALCKKNDSLKIPLLYSKCSLHFKLQQYDSLFYYGKQLQSYGKIHPNPKELGKYYHLMGKYHEKISNRYDSAFYYHNNAKKQFEQIHDSLRIGQRLIRMGYVQRTKGDYFGAKENLTEALRFLDLGNKNNLANLYNELGVVNRRLENIPEAIRFHQLAITTSTLTKDILIYKNNLGKDLSAQGNYKKALGIYEQIMAHKAFYEDSLNSARVFNNYAKTLWKYGGTNFLIDFNKALKIRKLKNYIPGIIDSYSGLGEYYSKSSPYLAKTYLDSAYRLSKKMKYPMDEVEILQLLMPLEPDNVDFKDRYIFLKDSLYQQELKVKTQFAHMKYEDVQEKKKLEQLETESIQKKAELAEQRLQNVLILVFSGLLFIIATIIYFAMGQKHKKEKLQEAYNTEKRISQKVHDELANEVYGFMANLQQVKKLEKGKLLDSIERIYHKTRDISYETGEIDTNDFYIEVKKLLTQYQNESTTITVKGLDPGIWDSVKAHKKVVVYRVINELLVNMSKHAEASLVGILFSRKNKNIEIRYTDNGKGFKPEQKYGIGLRNTENRIRSIGGILILDSEYRKGAKITVAFPV